MVTIGLINREDITECLDIINKNWGEEYYNAQKELTMMVMRFHGLMFILIFKNKDLGMS